MTVKLIVLFATLLVLGIVSMSLRRSLRQRPKARHYRHKFISLATDLIEKEEIPDVLARHLLMGASIPAGWLTRFMVSSLVYGVIVGGGARAKSEEDKEFTAAIMDLPPNLKARYVIALLSLAIGDSYRSAFFGAIWRGVNSWTFEAVELIRPDLDAHATKQVVVQVAGARPPVWARNQTRLEDCYA